MEKTEMKIRILGLICFMVSAFAIASELTTDNTRLAKTGLGKLTDDAIQSSKKITKDAYDKTKDLTKQAVDDSKKGYNQIKKDLNNKNNRRR